MKVLFVISLLITRSLFGTQCDRSIFQAVALPSLSSEQLTATRAYAKATHHLWDLRYRLNLSKQDRAERPDGREIAEVVAEMERAQKEFLETFHIRAKSVVTSYGTKYVILPDGGTALGRVAKRLEKLSHTTLELSAPREHIDENFWAGWDDSINSVALPPDTLVNIDLKTGEPLGLLKFTPGAIHELHHYDVWRKRNQGVPNVLHGYIEPSANDKKGWGAYDEAFTLDEFSTYPLDTYLTTRKLHKYLALAVLMEKSANSDKEKLLSELRQVTARAESFIADREPNFLPAFQKARDSLFEAQRFLEGFSAAHVLSSSKERTVFGLGENRLTLSVVEKVGKRHAKAEIMLPKAKITLELLDPREVEDLASLTNAGITPRRFRETLRRLVRETLIPRLNALASGARHQSEFYPQLISELRELLRAIPEGSSDLQVVIPLLQQIDRTSQDLIASVPS